MQTLIGCIGLVASFNIGTSLPHLMAFHNSYSFGAHLCNLSILQSCRLSSSFRLHYPEKGRRQHRWRRSCGLRSRNWGCMEQAALAGIELAASIDGWPHPAAIGAGPRELARMLADEGSSASRSWTPSGSCRSSDVRRLPAALQCG